MQSKKLELTALAGLGAQVVFLCATFALYSVSGSTAVYAETWHLIPGLLVWFTVLLHGRQRRLAAEEREELEELQKARLSEELFEEQELDTMRAQTGLRIFERYFVPALSVLLGLVLGGLAYYVMAGAWPMVGVVEVQQPAVVGVGMLFVTFLGFLAGKYTAGLAQEERFRLLRAAAGYLMGNVAAALLVMLSMVALHFGIGWPEQVLTYVIPVGMGLLAFEVIVNLILDIYRPRVPGRPARPPYDSRLLGLFAEPEGVLQTVAATLDYQFGFKVSETWFYQFMERAIVPLIIVWAVTLWLLSCMMVVDQHEVAFIERMGQPRTSEEDRAAGLKATVYGPGYYLKLPWPIEIARHVPAYEAHMLELGKIRYHEGERARPPSERAPMMTDPDVILWSERHIDPQEGYEADLLVPSTLEPSPKAEQEDERKAPPLNLARAMAYVQYRVKRLEDGTVDPRALWRYYYRHTDAKQMLRDLSYSALCRVAAHQDFLEWVSTRREECNREFQQSLQEAADRHELGVEIVNAGVPVVHPPAQVAGAYEEVVAAYQQKQATILQGRAEAKQILEGGEAEAVQTVEKARRDAYSIKMQAEAEQERFKTQLSAYRKAASKGAPEVYRYRKYMAAVEEILTGHRLYVLPVNRDEVQILDLQEKLRSELLEFDVEEATQ